MVQQRLGEVGAGDAGGELLDRDGEVSTVAQGVRQLLGHGGHGGLDVGHADARVFERLVKGLRVNVERVDRAILRQLADELLEGLGRAGAHLRCFGDSIELLHEVAVAHGGAALAVVTVKPLRCGLDGIGARGGGAGAYCRRHGGLQRGVGALGQELGEGLVRVHHRVVGEVLQDRGGLLSDLLCDLRLHEGLKEGRSHLQSAQQRPEADALAQELRAALSAAVSQRWRKRAPFVASAPEGFAACRRRDHSSACRRAASQTRQHAKRRRHDAFDA